MSPPCKRVAVVGGGFTGAAAVKWLKEEGMEPVCFEKYSEIGGTWIYREDDTEGLPSIMSTTTTISSKEFTCSSDFVAPKEAPNFLRHREMCKHFKAFVDKFDISAHVFCNKEVIQVKRTEDYEETGKWFVTVKDTKSGNITAEIFDGVMVCVGHICYPKMVEYPGMDKYNGKIMHSHSLKRFDTFTGQRVTVVGTGCSALDAAVEISSGTEQVYLSMRTPSWIVSRVGPYGIPMDYTLCRRYILFFQKILPLRIASWVIEQYFINKKFDHRLYGIEPKYPFLAKDPTVNDGISSKVLSGAVVFRKDIQYFTEDGVVFKGETQVTKTDTVIMATGYTWKFDFLEKGTINVEDGRFNLYKLMYPTHLKHPTLVFLGFFLPLGPGFAIAELQIRWAAHLLASGKNLPSEQVMLQDAQNRHEKNSERYSPSEKMTLRVDFIPYMDEIATELGASPNFWKMLFTDPRLLLACIFGPCIPAQYRLEGPHKLKEARETILTTHERMQFPLSAERLKKQENSCLKFLLTNLFIPLAIAYILVYNDFPFKYYISSFILFIYLLISKHISKFLFFFLLLPFFFNWHGLAALYILTIAAFTYFNLGNILVNRLFWT